MSKENGNLSTKLSKLTTISIGWKLIFLITIIRKFSISILIQIIQMIPWGRKITSKAFQDVVGSCNLRISLANPKSSCQLWNCKTSPTLFVSTIECHTSLSTKEPQNNYKGTGNLSASTFHIITESQNIPSWKGFTRIIKANSWLHAGSLKIPKHHYPNTPRAVPTAVGNCSMLTTI